MKDVIGAADTGVPAVVTNRHELACRSKSDAESPYLVKDTNMFLLLCFDFFSVFMRSSIWFVFWSALKGVGYA